MFVHNLLQHRFWVAGLYNEVGFHRLSLCTWFPFTATTLRTWVFSVNASVSVRRKAIEQHGGKSETFVGVLTTVVSLDCSDEAAQIGCKSGCGKPVCGESIMWNHHESNRGKVG